MLPAFQYVFNIPFSLPKLDLIGIPDFAAGAVENQGLITYKETAVFVEPKKSKIKYLSK